MWKNIFLLICQLFLFTSLQTIFFCKRVLRYTWSRPLLRCWCGGYCFWWHRVKDLWNKNNKQDKCGPFSSPPCHVPPPSPHPAKNSSSSTYSCQRLLRNETHTGCKHVVKDPQANTEGPAAYVSVHYFGEDPSVLVINRERLLYHSWLPSDKLVCICRTNLAGTYEWKL